MPYPRKYTESKTLKYFYAYHYIFHFISSCDKNIIFQVVRDVENYKEFVPWCVNSRIIPKLEASSDGISEVFFAEIRAGFLKFSDSYISKVSVYGEEKIEAEALDSGLFNHLKSTWKFTSNEDGTCTIEFFVDFEFNSYIYAYVANVFFLEISKGMLTAFEKRCLKISGKLNE